MKQAPILSEREKQRMLQHVQRTSYAARNRCMLMLSWLAGMRVGEIAALDVGDIVQPNGTIRDQIQLRANQTKGDQARTVLINSQLKAELDRYGNTLNQKLYPKRQWAVPTLPPALRPRWLGQSDQPFRSQDIHHHASPQRGQRSCARSDLWPQEHRYYPAVYRAERQRAA